MRIIKQCTDSECKNYTLKDLCPKCKSKTSEAGYKFIKIKNPQGKFRRKN